MVSQMCEQERKLAGVNLIFSNLHVNYVNFHFFAGKVGACIPTLANSLQFSQWLDHGRRHGPVSKALQQVPQVRRFFFLEVTNLIGAKPWSP